MKQFNELPLLLRMGAVTQLLKAGRSTVYRLIDRGKLESVQSRGGQQQVTRESVRRYLKLPSEGALVEVL
jgi:excisionase family DNA binding protein